MVIFMSNIHLSIKVMLIILCFFTFELSASAQKPMDEEKVKKAVLLMQKMMTDPGQMQNVMTEMQALKLNSAENKEAQARMKSSALKNADEIKKQVTATGGITEKQITEFNENKDRIVPLRDDVRINSVLKRNLTDAEMPNFCKAVFAAVKKELDPSVISQSEKIYADMKAEGLNYTLLGNGAISCYFTNMTMHSLYIYGKVCSEDPANANNLNNYAALLTMQGVEQGAIPLLNYLNKRYARSPYVWSNLSVAWLGLGDLKTAEKYADSCIRFFPGHAAQAHYVKSVVKEGEGDKEKAVEELKKSIELGYSSEKDKQLRNKKRKPDNLLPKFRAGLPDDVMGLNRFYHPTIPRTYAEALVSATQWKSYYTTLDAEYKLLVKKMEDQLKSMGKTSWDYMVKEASKTDNSGHIYAFSATNITSQRMEKITALLEDEFIPKEENFFKRMNQIQEDIKRLKEEMEKEEEQISKRYENFCGEGQTCPEMEICNAYLANVDKYMAKVNLVYDKYFSDYLSFKKQEFNELIYAAHFILGKEQFEYEKNRRKMLFLGALMSVIYEFPSWALKPRVCIENSTVEKIWTLPAFKELNCFNNLKLDLPMFSMSGCDKFKVDQKLIDEIDKMEYVHTGPMTDGSIITEEDLAPLQPEKKAASENDDEELAPLGPIKKTNAAKNPDKGTSTATKNVKRIEFDRSGFTDFQTTPGNNITPGATGKNIILAGKPSFEIKSAFKQVVINYK